MSTQTKNKVSELNKKTVDTALKGDKLKDMTRDIDEKETEFTLRVKELQKI